MTGLELDVDILSCWMPNVGTGQAGNRAAITALGHAYRGAGLRKVQEQPESDFVIHLRARPHFILTRLQAFLEEPALPSHALSEIQAGFAYQHPTLLS